jgi:hypothetical protein
MDFVSIVFGAVDVPLVVGIVVLIEGAKKVVKIKAKGWAVVLLVAGFAAAFLKVPLSEGWRTLVVQGIIYAAAAEFVYQGGRTIRDALAAKRAKG